MQTQLAVLSLVSAPQNTVTCLHLYGYYCPRPVDAVSCCKWEYTCMSVYRNNYRNYTRYNYTN